METNQRQTVKQYNATNEKTTMYFMSDALLCFRQMRKRELQLGRRLIGDNARLCGDNDAVCPVHLLRIRLCLCSRVRAPDLCQNEHW